VSEKATALNIPEGIYCGEAVGIEHYRLNEWENSAPIRIHKILRVSDALHGRPGVRPYRARYPELAQ